MEAYLGIGAQFGWFVNWDSVSFENFVNSFMSTIDSSSNIYKLSLECENELDDHDIRKLYVRICKKK